MSITSKKVIILGITSSIVIHLGIGFMFASSDHRSQKIILVCDPTPYIDEREEINLSDSIPQENTEPKDYTSTSHNIEFRDT